MLNRNNDFDCSKARRELGFHCRPFAESIRDTVTWLRREGFVETEEKARVMDISLAVLLSMVIRQCVRTMLIKRYNAAAARAR